MRKILVIAAPLLLLAACSGGDGATGVKPAAGPSLDGPLMGASGLWRTTTTIDGQQPFGANLACVDAASQKAQADQLMPSEAGCEPPARRPIPGGFAYEATCRKDGVTMSTTGEVKGDAKRLTISSTSRMTGPDGEMTPPSTMRVESVHVGPCPADMKPGDSRQEGIGGL